MGGCIRKEGFGESDQSVLIVRVFPVAIYGKSADTFSFQTFYLLLRLDFYGNISADSPGKWAAVSVKRVLENQVYIGTMVQGKEEKVSYKLKKRINFKSICRPFFKSQYFLYSMLRAPIWESYSTTWS